MSLSLTRRKRKEEKSSKSFKRTDPNIRHHSLPPRQSLIRQYNTPQTLSDQGEALPGRVVDEMAFREGDEVEVRRGKGDAEAALYGRERV